MGQLRKYRGNGSGIIQQSRRESLFLDISLPACNEKNTILKTYLGSLRQTSQVSLRGGDSPLPSAAPAHRSPPPPPPLSSWQFCMSPSPPTSGVFQCMLIEDSTAAPAVLQYFHHAQSVQLTSLCDFTCWLVG